MKKIKALVMLCITSILFSTAPVLAENYAHDAVVSLQIGNPIMTVNGTETEIDVGRGTVPVIKNGRTLVPVRAIVEAFGGNVSFEESTKTVCLTMQNDVIKLVIGSTAAYFNDEISTLDVAPSVINGRTLLPIRFIAESFNLGVAWDGNNKTVFIIRDSLTDKEYNYLMSVIPKYSSNPYVKINGNQPFFEDYEFISGSFEYYSKLDELERCNVCMASVAEDIMPDGERRNISAVKPSGWNNKSYNNVPGGYVYNRCHLIGYQLTGENENERNIITGTRYLNVEGMLPFENMVDDYIEKTGNHVMYRSTPVFKENNLVADGVLLEAYSVEDGGKGISFCVYCYNVQPDIIIDYRTGENHAENSNKDEKNTVDYMTVTIYRTPSGKKYHYKITCGGKNSYEVTLEEAIAAGLAPCQKCVE